MLYIHQLNPVAIDIWGVLQIRWYGLAYIAGLWVAYLLGLKKCAFYSLSQDDFLDLLSYLALGLLAGGRIGYVAVYKTTLLLQNPWMIFALWQGGMSFHGAIVGGLVALVYFARRKHVSALSLIDFAAPLIPPGLFLGRFGNFINAELWGRPTDGSWGVVFPNVDALARHPSQLYEMLGEGVFLFWIMHTFEKYKTKDTPQGMGGVVFMFSYGVIRFLVEFFREPDVDVGFVYGQWMTMGQLLCVFMLATAAVWAVLLYVVRSELCTEGTLQKNSLA